MPRRKIDSKTSTGKTTKTKPVMKKASGSKSSSKRAEAPKRRGRRPKKILEDAEASDRDVESPTSNPEASEGAGEEAPAIIAKLPYIPVAKRKTNNTIGGVTRSRGILEMTQTYEKLHGSKKGKDYDSAPEAGSKRRGRKPKKFEPVLDDSDEDVFLSESGNGGNCSQCAKHQRLEETLRNQISSLEKKLKGSEKLNVYVSDLNLVSVKGKKYKLKKTSLRCRWDQHPFDTLPFPLPERYVDGTYHTSYCFCSPNCALKFNIQRNDTLVDHRTTLIFKLYREMTRTPLKDKLQIKPADEIDVIDCNGGPKTIEEYREDFLNLDRECRIYVPPIRPINLVIEEETDSGVKDTELLELPFRPSKKVSVITSMRASGRR